MSNEYTPPPGAGLGQTSPSEPASPPPLPPSDGGMPTGPMTPAEIEGGKVMAVLVYAIAFVFPLFWIVPLVMRDNRFSLYHAKQGLVLFVVGVIAYVVLAIGTIVLAFVTCGFGALLAWPVMLGFAIFLIVLNIIGLVNAAQGRAAPLPAIGRWGEKWFAGINVAAGPSR